MPLADLGTIVLHHAVFLIHLVYMSLAFSRAEPSWLPILYCASKLFARRPEDFDVTKWTPSATASTTSTTPKW